MSDWVQQRLGGYVKLSIEERRAAVRELTKEGHSNVGIGKLLGVDEGTIRNDKGSENSETLTEKNKKTNGGKGAASENSDPVDIMFGLGADSALRKEAERREAKTVGG